MDCRVSIDMVQSSAHTGTPCVPPANAKFVLIERLRKLLSAHANSFYTARHHPVLKSRRLNDGAGLVGRFLTRVYLKDLHISNRGRRILISTTGGPRGFQDDRSFGSGSPLSDDWFWVKQPGIGKANTGLAFFWSVSRKQTTESAALELMRLNYRTTTIDSDVESLSVRQSLLSVFLECIFESDS